MLDVKCQNTKADKKIVTSKLIINNTYKDIKYNDTSIMISGFPDYYYKSKLKHTKQNKI